MVRSLPPPLSTLSKPTDIRIREVAWSTQEIAYRAPMKFGGRVVESCLLFDVEAVVETRAGLVGRGRGSMPLGNIWAWPAGVDPAATLRAMRDFAERCALAAAECADWGHPLELTHTLAGEHERLAREVIDERGIASPMPRLAQLVSASPLEAALYDAQGRALQRNAYDLLGAEFVSADLARWLGPEFAGEYLEGYTLRAPQPRMPLYHLVGALDPLTAADVATPIGDRLPEHLGEWIEREGLTHLKIKLNGDDLRWDVERVVGVERVAAETQRRLKRATWHYSLDFNERCAHVNYLLDFMAALEARAPQAWQRVQYIEQPTHRDLAAHRENRMHAAAARKPVVIDESLVDFASLQLARELGYSGVALKACKGHTEALLMGAAAQRYGLFLCVQDLTCPGASLLHSATLAARTPGVAAIEANARQYCPAGNRAWAERYPGFFQVVEGSVETGFLTGPGLGF